MEPLPVAPSATSPAHPHRRLLIAVLITGAISSLVSLVLMYGLPSHVPGFREEVKLGFTFGPLPFSVMYTENDEGALVPMTRNVEGAELFVIDAVTAAGVGTYYALGTSEGTSTNIYLEAADGMLTQLTDSESMKYGLAYDPFSQSLTYVSSTDRDLNRLVMEPQDIMLLAGTSTAVKIAEGSAAVPLRDATYFLVRGDEGISVVAREATTTAPAIIPVGRFEPLAINTEEANIAVYNRTTKAVDLYDLGVGGAFVSYASSVALEQVPTAIAFRNGEIIAARSVSGEARDDYEVWYPQGGRSHMVLAPEARKGIPPIMTIRAL